MPHAVESPHENSQYSLDGKYLYVNDGLLAPEEVGWLRSSYPDEPIEELRARYEKDGFLLLKGVLPREDVLKAREAYFLGVSHSEVLKPGTQPMEGIFDPAKDAHNYPGIGAGNRDEDASHGNDKPKGASGAAVVFVDAALAQHTAPWYWNQNGTGFAQHPKLKEFIASFSGWREKTVPVMRTLLRNNTPGNKAIGVHYDQIFMRYGEPTSITAWVPIGDVGVEGGGLIYLEGGEKIGAEIEQDFERKAKASGMTEEQMKYAFNQNMMSTGFLSDGPKDFARKYGGRWLVTAYEAGDVVLHKAHSVCKWLAPSLDQKTRRPANHSECVDSCVNDQS